MAHTAGMHTRRHHLRWLLAAAALPAAGPARAATENDSALAIRTALERGAVAAVGLLGRTDGFLGNPKVRIPLPGVLEDAAGMLRTLGQQRRVDELVTAMNRAAEAAVPEARQLLVNTVKALTVEDAVRIVSGGDDAATKFFAGKTREPLTERFLPIVGRATEKVKLAAKYDAVAGRAARLGLVKAEDADMKRYVTGRALDGLYLVIGEEERKIRRDPVGTGSAILKKVFGSLR
jgi:hypothetical protein